MKEKFKDYNFKPESLALIDACNDIIAQYQANGYDLTLRQVYYRLVACDFIPNNSLSYKRVGRLVNRGRLAGLIDWSAIVDRTRSLRKNAHFDSPAAIMKVAVFQFAIDKWADQPCRVEVWVEKDALAGVIAPVCAGLDVPFFSSRGYTSQSSQYAAAARAAQAAAHNQDFYVVCLTDHDPSGLDMKDDLSKRFEMFGVWVDVWRIALTMTQINEHAPPPNYAKISDSRSLGYIAVHGRQSWELDALEPPVIVSLVENAVLSLRDDDAWEKSLERESGMRAGLEKAREAVR